MIITCLAFDYKFFCGTNITRNNKFYWNYWINVHIKDQYDRGFKLPVNSWKIFVGTISARRHLGRFGLLFFKNISCDLLIFILDLALWGLSRTKSALEPLCWISRRQIIYTWKSMMLIWFPISLSCFHFYAFNQSEITWYIDLVNKLPTTLSKAGHACN